MWCFIPRAVGTENEHYDLKALIADLAADCALEVSWHVRDQISDYTEQLASDLINR